MSPRYPLGVDAAPDKSHRTGPNRRAVGYCLSILWVSPDALADRTTERHGASQVGMPLNGRLVTRLELQAALVRLQIAREDLHTPLWWVYGRNYTKTEAADLLQINETTLRDRVNAGLNFLIDELWDDPPGPGRRTERIRP